jgi:hypothetical protein
VRKYPLARSNIFLRLARRLVPRFTRGIIVLLFSFNLLAAGGKDDSPDCLSGIAQESPAISDLFTRPKQLLIS